MSEKTPKSADRKHDTDVSMASSSTDEKRYQWPPVRDPNLSYKAKSRNPVQSVITALPLIMVVVGFLIYFLAESRQTHGTPIQSESMELSGVFTGFSTTGDRQYLWLDINDVAKGIRIKDEHMSLLDTLARGKEMQIKVAPRVTGSSTYWALHIEQGGTVLLNEQIWLGQQD